MKKNLLIVAALGGMFWSANEAKAQETIEGVVVEETPVLVQEVDCKDIYTPGSWKDNWFIQLGAGIRSPFMENYRVDGKSDSRKITAIYNLGVGRWISPYLGFRFSAYYGSMHWNQGHTASARVANLNVDFMWDMFNSIGGYRPHRVFSIVPYIGLGGSFVYRYRPAVGNIQDRHGDGVKSNQWLLPVSAGLQLRFRLCEYVDFFAEGRAMFYGDNFNNDAYGRPVDIDISAVGGFTFHLTGSKFKRYNPCDYVDYINRANAQINDLRGALATTSAALAAAEAQLPCPDATVVEASSTTILPTVRFKINSAYVSSEEMVNVYNVAEYMKANPDATIVVRGYADEDTGTAEYNMKLSERRAQAVADILVGDYGIDPARLVLEAAGSNTQVYDTNDWNRIVIFAIPE